MAETVDELERLARFIIGRAVQETTSTHVEVSFEPQDAAHILNVAEKIIRERYGDATVREIAFLGAR